MSGLDKQTTDRMRRAVEVEIDDQTKRAHLASISDALSDHPPTDLAAVSRPSKTLWWRMRVRTLIAAMVVVLPVGTAIAAENTVPGDLLYSVKLAAEPIRSVFDSDVAARHRVAELEHLMDHPNRTDMLPSAVSSAEQAVTDLPIDHPLRDQLAMLTDMATDMMQPPPEGSGGTQHDRPMHDSPTDESPTDTPHDNIGETDLPPESDTPGQSDMKSGDSKSPNMDTDSGEIANDATDTESMPGSSNQGATDTVSGDHTHQDGSTDMGGSDGAGAPGDGQSDG